MSLNPAPTAFSVDANAQASGNILGYGVTGGVSGSLTNFTGLQVFGRVTTPDANQVTVSGTIPPSTLASMGKAISDAAAIKAGLPVDQQAGAAARPEPSRGPGGATPAGDVTPPGQPPPSATAAQSKSTEL